MKSADDGGTIETLPYSDSESRSVNSLFKEFGCEAPVLLPPLSSSLKCCRLAAFICPLRWEIRWMYRYPAAHQRSHWKCLTSTLFCSQTKTCDAISVDGKMGRWGRGCIPPSLIHPPFHSGNSIAWTLLFLSLCVFFFVNFPDKVIVNFQKGMVGRIWQP